MKLLDILLEGTVEYKVKFVIIKDKDVSQGSASYKDLADAKKFFDSLTNDPEVYRAQIDKVLGADSSRNMGAMSFTGGTEEIERYSHPAVRSSKKFDELTPAEQDIRMFANSRLGTMGKKGFTSKDGTYKYLEEGLNDGMMQDIINDPNRRVYDLVDWFNHSVPMYEKDWDAFMHGRYEKFLNNKDAETKAKMYKVLQRMTNK